MLGGVSSRLHSLARQVHVHSGLAEASALSIVRDRLGHDSVLVIQVIET